MTPEEKEKLDQLSEENTALRKCYLRLETCLVKLSKTARSRKNTWRLAIVAELPEEILKLIGVTATYIGEVFECWIALEKWREAKGISRIEMLICTSLKGAQKGPFYACSSELKNAIILSILSEAKTATR